MGGNQLDGAGLFGRLDDLCDREQRDVGETAGNVAGQRFQQRWQQRGGQMRPLGLQRIEHRGGGPPRVIGGQAPLVEDAGGQKWCRQHLHIARQRQRLADRAASLLSGRQAAARGRGGQDRRDLVEPL